MRLNSFASVLATVLAFFSCQEEASTPVSQLGVSGVMPTIGKIYIEEVKLGANDGDLSDMRRAHLEYRLSADIVLNDYSVLDGGKARCVWSSNQRDTQIKQDETILAKNAKTGLYECASASVVFYKRDSSEYEPDTIISVKFKDNAGNYINRVGTDEVYYTTIPLNTTDRHNLVTLASSATTTLFHRRDGLFQSGYTAYRGIKGLEKYIGSATYEARVKTPGAIEDVRITDKTSKFDSYIATDNTTIDKWLSGVRDKDFIKSSSVFVSSYGPPIALPPFRKGEIDYNKLRLVLLRHNNNPIIISNDRKLWTMGSYTSYGDNATDIKENYRYHIRQNDNWFSYSGVDIYGNNNVSSVLHVGEIRPANGVAARFVSTVSAPSDVGSIVALNETDREYYIAGNPHYNNSFCESKATFDYETNRFDFNKSCKYVSSVNVGAVKITGLQRLIGDGSNAVATDNAIYYTGPDERVYVVNIRPDNANYNRIKNGEEVMPEPVGWELTERDRERGADKLYAVEMALPTMNPASIPTLLLSDGSIAFGIRSIYDNGSCIKEDCSIVNSVRHFYVNRDGGVEHKAGDAGNIRMTKLLGSTVALGEDSKIYYFTDIEVLGVSYNPQTNKNNAAGTPDDRVVGGDYLAFVQSDPVQLFRNINNADTRSKEAFFKFQYGELDINKALGGLEDGSGQNEMDSYAFMPYNPYAESFEEYVGDSTSSGGVRVEVIKDQPYRTNAYLFINMTRGAKYNYILVPRYAYGFDKYIERDAVDAWRYKANGLVAAEVRNNDVAKVYGTFTIPEVDFRYTPNDRNTAYFGNKKGIFSFVNYNTRVTGSSFVDTNGAEATVPATDVANSVTILIDNKTPDYFYRAKVVGASPDGTIYEEANSQGNYIGNAFVNEARMSNFPNNTDYQVRGFEPQLLSSWVPAEFSAYPSTEDNATGLSSQASNTTLPGYILQYFYSKLFAGTPDGYAGIAKGSNSANLETFIGNLYQYAYGVGLYRLYSPDVYPVWRARKYRTEVLQQQVRYGTLLPMTHGKTASFLFDNYKVLFEDGAKFNNTDYKEIDKAKDPKGNYLYPRLYTTSLYTVYDADMLRQLRPIEEVILGGIDISTQILGKTIQDSKSADIDGKQGSIAQGSGVGYILLDGNYMWREGSKAYIKTGTPVSGSDPLNKDEYFDDFVAFH